MESPARYAPRFLLVATLAGVTAALPAAAQKPPPPPAGGPGLAPPPPAADPIAVALAPKPGGLTAEDAAKIVSKTKHSVRSKQEELRAAAAKVDQAFVNFFPRVSLSATYTRLSNVPPFSLGSQAFVFAKNAGALGTKCDPTGQNCLVVDSKGQPVGGTALPPFAVPLNSYSFVASLAVPISDYVFRISQGYGAASHNERAKRLNLEAEMLQAGADAKMTFYNWVSARGQVVVAHEAVEQVKAHVEDARKAFAVGLSSRADVMRLEAQLAAAQQGQAAAEAFQSIAGEQLRIALQAPPDARLELGSDVLHDSPVAPAESLQAAQDQAMERRLEIRALDETIYSLKKVEQVARAGYLPRLDGFADATMANPNQRIFPSREQFDGTWDIGLRLSWTLNDTFTTIGASAEAKANTAAVLESRAALRDGLRIEVAAAYADSVKAPATLEAAERGLASAEESYRVRRELFKNGKATTVDLIDAESELTRARLARLDAHIQALVARARFEHATGRDAPAPNRAEGPANDARGPMRGPLAR